MSTQAREWWIDFNHATEKTELTTKRIQYTGGPPPHIEQVHVIEHSAYASLQALLEQSRAEVAEANRKVKEQTQIIDDEAFISRKNLADLRAQLAEALGSKEAMKRHYDDMYQERMELTTQLKAMREGLQRAWHYINTDVPTSDYDGLSRESNLKALRKLLEETAGE